MKVIVTGAAGFIGFHVSQRLLARGDEVVGVDTLNSYYDPALKAARLGELGVTEALALADHAEAVGQPGFRFARGAVEDAAWLAQLMDRERPDAVVHLAAQVGVRYAVQAPFDYGRSNLMGFLSVLEATRACQPQHIVYASSSSVYGEDSPQPLSTDARADRGASKSWPRCPSKTWPAPIEQQQKRRPLAPRPPRRVGGD